MTGPGATALAGARIFDGARMVDGHAVVMDGGTIGAVVPEDGLPAGLPVRRIAGLLAPGFIDVQVNGGGGILFNDDTTVEGIAAIGRAHRRFGTTGFLPTFITGGRAKQKAAIAASEAAIDAGVPGVLGIHLEGPFINPERKGVHDAGFIRAMDEEDVVDLAAPRGGRTLVTLAPEMVPVARIAWLSEAGIILSAGHTAATREQVAEARRAGLTGFTHLFNAMPPLAGREPGPVGAALDDRDAWCSLIVDLIHVSATSLRVALAARGFERTMLITDAMPTIGTDIESFELDGRTIIRREGRLATAEGTLAGCHLDMATAVRNSVHHLGLPVEAALHMASRAPAEFLGLGHRLGRIAPGYRAGLVLLDDDLRVVDTWIDGIASGDTEIPNAPAESP